MHPSSPTPLHTRRVTAKEEGPIALLMRKGVEVRVRDVTNFLGDKASVDGGQQCGITPHAHHLFPCYSPLCFHPPSRSDPGGHYSE